jgi:hypothetical protein
MLCLGCQAPPGAIDPFIGRQTVPPPGTGTPAAVPPGDAYYTPKAGEPSPSGTPYAPPGGFSGRYSNQDNSVATKPGTSRPSATIANGVGAPPSTKPAARETTPAPAGSGGSPVRPAGPADSPPGSSASRATPRTGFVNNNPPPSSPPARTASSRTPVTGIGSRPAAQTSPANTSQPSAQSPAPQDSGTFRRPSSTIRANHEEARPAAGSATAATSRTPRREVISPGKYEADHNYRWLKGKLEYSKIDDRWKLRYIPIDGDTDEFGGSVVLVGSRLLEGYKAGEYVTVHGSLGETDSRGGGFAPSYTVDKVVRQAEE